MALVYVDANVLIAAARGTGTEAARAFAVLDDDSHEFAASDFLRLEVPPKAVYHKQLNEAAFYRRFFNGVAVWTMSEPRLVKRAQDIAQRFGLSAVDALHVAAAMSAKASALITGELRSKPLHRVTTIPVWTIHP
jgi:predicted nucleic acid-binding protein